MDMPEMKKKSFFLLVEYTNLRSYCKKNRVLDMNSLNLLKCVYKKPIFYAFLGTVVPVLGFNTYK